MRTLRLLPYILLAGCAGGDSGEVAVQDSSMDYTVAAPAPAAAPAPQGFASREVAQRSASKAATIAGGSTGAALPAGALQQASAVIRTGSASIEVPVLDSAVASVRQLAASLGGYIANTTLHGGQDQVPSATVELKLPAERFDQAITGLEPVGDVESVSVEAQDVGEELVDLEARIANARRLEARLVELLATRTGRLEDVLAVERELARVREEIERYEGRLRYLRSRVAISTLVVSLHEPRPILGHTSNPIAESVRDAWRNFVGTVAIMIAGLGALLPVAIVVGAAAFIAQRILRRRSAVNRRAATGVQA
jgi:hypothetical protein